MNNVVLSRYNTGSPSQPSRQRIVLAWTVAQWHPSPRGRHSAKPFRSVADRPVRGRQHQELFGDPGWTSPCSPVQPQHGLVQHVVSPHHDDNFGSLLYRHCHSVEGLAGVPENEGLLTAGANQLD